MNLKSSLPLLAACLIAAPTAHAYIDPASGSFLLQIVLGGLATAFVTLKVFWRRLRRRNDGTEQP
jgi:hypothetical protein